MAQLPINNPPLKVDLDDDDDNDDLFISAIGSQHKKDLPKQEEDLNKEFNNIDLNNENQRPAVIEDINLNDDDNLTVSNKEKQNKIQPSSITPPVYRDSDSESPNSLKRATISPQSTVFKMSEESANNGQTPPIISSSSTFQQQSRSKDEQFIEIRVVEPKKSGEGIGAYVLYKVITRTNLPFFRRESFTVNRRFSDFLGLREKLAEKYLFSGRIVPPAPSKDAYNTAKVKMAKEDPTEHEFLEKRAKELERFLNRIGEHQVLRSDPDFREFLELETDLPKATGTSALSSAGVKRLLSRVGETVNKMTYKMDETDPWFEEKQHQVDNLDQQLRKLHASIEALIHHRKELTTTTGQFSKSIAMLGNCEEHTSLSCALSQLAETEEKLEQLYGQQVYSDFYYLAELVKDYINLIAVVKDVFHNRVKVFQIWQNAQQTLAKKKEAKLKYENSGKTDRVHQANEEIAEWEAKVNRGQEDFENISKTIKAEFEKLEISRIKDFKKNILKYMETLLDTQQKIIVAWESFAPELRSIS